MRFLAVLVVTGVWVGCGGASGHRPGTPAPATASAFPAARWVPANPSYLISAPTFRAGQHALVNLIDALAPVSGGSSRDASAAFEHRLGVDPLSPEAVSAIGVDLDAGVILFSEGLNPTFVLRLAAPDAMAKFFEQLRTKGMVTQSVFVDSTEVFSARLSRDAGVAWAIDGDWMWVHFTFAPHEDQGAAWFLHSHHADPARWAATWSWVRDHATPQSVQGFFSPQAMLATFASVPQVAACTKLFAPVAHVGLSVEGDLRQASARITFDVGASGPAIASSLLPPPPGWAAGSAAAPIDLEWNLDVAAISGWADPCLAGFGESLQSLLDDVGVRAARVLVRAFDPDHRGDWSAAVVADVTQPRYFAAQLDRIDFPGRSLFEKSKQFGPYAGKRIAAPTFPAVEYSLGDKLVLLGVGDGMLDQIVAAPAQPPPPAPLATLQLHPQAMSAKAWSSLISFADLSGNPTAAADLLLVWREAHITLTVSGPDLILEAGGVRR